MAATGVLGGESTLAGTLLFTQGRDGWVLPCQVGLSTFPQNRAFADSFSKLFRIQSFPLTSRK
jgi:hypothetical protein